MLMTCVKHLNCLVNGHTTNNGVGHLRELILGRVPWLIAPSIVKVSTVSQVVLLFEVLSSVHWQARKWCENLLSTLSHGDRSRYGAYLLSNCDLKLINSTKPQSTAQIPNTMIA